MEIDNCVDSEGGEIILYPNSADLRKLIEGESIWENHIKIPEGKQEIVVSIHPDIVEVNSSEEVYDDLMDAMNETYSLLRYLFEFNGNPSNLKENYNVEKIQQTYLHYRELQKQYE